MNFGKKVGGGGITQQSAATGDWPKGLRDGETRVRFLAEIPDWEDYWEHFDETVKFFPCTGNKSECPGCTSQIERTAKASHKYLAPVLDPKTGKVWGLKMGIDLANRLSLRNDRNNGTITNRDYTLIRSGDGLETEYDVEQEERVAIDLDVYSDTINIEELLSSQFSAAWPDFSTNCHREDPPAPKKAVPAKKTAPAPRQRKPEPVEEPTETEKIVTDIKARGAAKAEAEAAMEEPPFETNEQASEGGDTVEITEDDLRAMSRPDLIKLARQAEIPITLTMSREEIVDLFLNQFSV